MTTDTATNISTFVYSSVSSFQPYLTNITSGQVLTYTPSTAIKVRLRV